MVLGQPLTQARRQQQLLTTITRQEVLGHRTPHRSRTTESSPSAKTEQRPQQGFMRHPPRKGGAPALYAGAGPSRRIPRTLSIVARSAGDWVTHQVAPAA